MSKKIKLTSFQPDENNFNNHTQYGMSLLEKSVERVGVIESITVSADDKVISGNARQEVMLSKFENIEPIVIETDGTRPVIIKRNDIKGNTKRFTEAALLANTVSKHNINLDLQKIEEIAVVEFDIDVEELGIDIVSFSDKNKEIDIDALGEDMVIKLKYTEEDYYLVKEQLAKIAQTPEQAVWKLLNNE
jgi:hypothetical protein